MHHQFHRAVDCVRLVSPTISSTCVFGLLVALVATGADPYFVPNRGQARVGIRFVGGTIGQSVLLGDSFATTLISGTEIVTEFVGSSATVSLEGRESLPTR